MDLPQPPDDPDLKNIIDKLANFVARNGPDFENMTKQKQKENPKFSFLFGGPNFNYYTFRVNTEQAIMKNQLKQQQQQQPPAQQPPPPGTYQAPPPQPPQPPQPPSQPAWQPPPQYTPHVQPPQPPQPAPTLANPQIVQMREQIQQSEQNLAAQYTSMMQQQQVQMDEHIRSSREERVRRLAEAVSVSRDELDSAVQPIIEACTKDAISNGKNWMFTHSQTPQHCELIAQYLLYRVCAPDAPFSLRLHLIYLINDVLHHCTRKNAEDLRRAIESVVVGIFCTAHHTPGTEPAHRLKLEKLLDLWRKNGYFQPAVLEALKDPTTALRAFQKSCEDENAGFLSGVKAATQQQYQGLQKQHQEFVNHMNAQIQALSYQQAPAPYGAPATTQPPPFNPNAPPPFAPSQPLPTAAPPSGRTRPSRFNQPPPDFVAQPAAPEFDPSRPPPFQNPNQMPPLIPPTQPEPDLTPNVPYYELPAGLMAPLVKLEDSDYEPLDPKVMRLPPPMPPSERLLAAVEAFYAQPSHDRPRDSEGWEKLGLFEFYRAKQKAKKAKEERGEVKVKVEIKEEPREQKLLEKPKRRRKFDSERERLKSRSNSPKRRSRTRSRSRSRSSSKSKSRSRSRSPTRSQSTSSDDRKEKSKSRSRSRSPKIRSRSRSKSPSPRRRSSSKSKSKSRSRSPRRRSRSKSKSASPARRRRSRTRSPSPPEFTSARFPISAPVSVNTRLGEENKGHMLMKKMGWSGGGLGQAEQGIVEPIKAGEVRDRSDQFKGIGVGVADDPFEQFRKNQSAGFISRMKARTEEKPQATTTKKRGRREAAD